MKAIKRSTTVLIATIFLISFRWLTIKIGFNTFQNVITPKPNDTHTFIMFLRIAYEVLLEIGLTLLVLMSYDILKRLIGFKGEYLYILCAAPFLFYFSTFLRDMSCIKPLLSFDRFLVYTVAKAPYMILCLWLLLQRRIILDKGHGITLMLILICFTLFKFTHITLV